MDVINIAAYKFASLSNLSKRREELRARCKALKLRGTILLATEGVNLFVAGQRSSVDELVAALAGDAEIGPLDVKESVTDYQPFRRMLVKIKREIISFGINVPTDEPAGDKISAETLSNWLDEGRDVLLLDTRNEYEVEVGTFSGAVSPAIDSFTQFPSAVESFPDEWRDRPIVTFCTGGIRCEKAAPYLRQRGFRNVLQLEGGILKYFEQIGGKHYNGDCFVFDRRVAVDAALRETDAALCYACQTVLDAEDQASPLYVVGEHCPHCHQTDDETMAAVLQQRTDQLRRAGDPLPGSTPYENRRPIYVPARCGGMLLYDFLTDAVPALSRGQWQNEVEARRVQLNGAAVDASHTVTAGERLEHVTPDVIEPDVNATIEFVYEDAALVVLNKPAPLPMHPSGRYNKNTLTMLLEPLYRPQRLRPVHRLDANTTGLVVFARTGRIAQRLQQQFEAGAVEKTYVARVHGHPAEDEFLCNASIAYGPSKAGIRITDCDGLPAETRFSVIQRDRDGTWIVEARPVTGRTNQIRVHLWSLGLPIVGDPTYAAQRETNAQQTLAVVDPPMCLHASRLVFQHPTKGEPITLVSPPPSWAVDCSTMIEGVTQHPSNDTSRAV